MRKRNADEVWCPTYIPKWKISTLPVWRFVYLERTVLLELCAVTHCWWMSLDSCFLFPRIWWQPCLPLGV